MRASAGAGKDAALEVSWDTSWRHTRRTLPHLISCWQLILPPGCSLLPFACAVSLIEKLQTALSNAYANNTLRTHTSGDAGFDSGHVKYRCAVAGSGSNV
jgi:hypothetical protein